MKLFGWLAIGTGVYFAALAAIQIAQNEAAARATVMGVRG